MLNKKLLIRLLLATLLLLIIILNKEHSESDMNAKFLVKETFSVEPLPLKSVERSEKMLRLKYTSDKFQAGMNVLIYGHPNIVKAGTVFKRLRSLGVNSVALNFPFYQSDWKANEVTTSPIDTPTIPELRKLIELAHDSGLSVMIRPIMDEQALLSSNRWRGQIKPKDPNVWFDSYQTLILTYAKLAEATNVKSLNIGTELTSMQHQYQEKWTELIENVRHVYKGELLYSFNYDTVSEIPSTEFVKLLDYVGIDAYFPLDLPNDASIDMLEGEWKKQIDQLKKTLWNESIIVTEAGILPVTGAYRTPYAWSLPNGIYDPQAQVNYYEATYNVWKPKVDGIYWWVVTLGQDPNEVSFSPLRLPTEKVIERQFLKGAQNE